MDGPADRPNAGDGGLADGASLASTTANIGPAGGTLSVEGVTVTIPAGALATGMQLTMNVLPGPVVNVSPDVAFDLPVEVTMNGSRWPRGGPRLAQHLSSGEWYLIDQVTDHPDSSWSYRTIEFSNTQAGPASVIPECLTPWHVSDVCGSPSESGRTVIPKIERKDVTKKCLADASNIVGARHDGVSQPASGPARAQDEAWTMTEEAKTALAATRDRLRTQHPELDIWVNGAWDSSGRFHGQGTPGSYHYFGAALDLVLWDGTSKVTDEAVLGLLPPILIQSGFTWVWYEDPRHIHASISSPSLAKCKLDVVGTWHLVSYETGNSPGFIPAGDCASAVAHNAASVETTNTIVSLGAPNAEGVGSYTQKPCYMNCQPPEAEYCGAERPGTYTLTGTVATITVASGQGRLDFVNDSDAGVWQLKYGQSGAVHVCEKR